MESVKFITACPECILRAQGHHMQSLFGKKILTLPTSIANNTIDWLYLFIFRAYTREERVRFKRKPTHCYYFPRAGTADIS